MQKNVLCVFFGGDAISELCFVMSHFVKLCSFMFSFVGPATFDFIYKAVNKSYLKNDF